MRALARILSVGIGCFLVFPSSLNARQLPLYLERADGLQLEKQQDFLGALVRFKVLLALLVEIQKTNPSWEHDLVMKDIVDSQAKIAALTPLAAKQISDKNAATLSSGPSISTLYDAGVKEPDALKAMHELEEYHSRLEIAHASDPNWEKAVVEDRLKKSGDLIDQLAPRVISESMPIPGADGRTVQ